MKSFIEYLNENYIFTKSGTEKLDISDIHARVVPILP